MRGRPFSQGSPLPAEAQVKDNTRIIPSLVGPLLLFHVGGEEAVSTYIAYPANHPVPTKNILLLEVESIYFSIISSVLYRKRKKYR